SSRCRCCGTWCRPGSPSSPPCSRGCCWRSRSTACGGGGGGWRRPRASVPPLFAGLRLAVAVDGLWWGGGRLRRSLAVVTALVVLAFLVPAAPLRPSPVVATPPFFTTSALTRLPRDQVALVVPFPRKGRANQAMRWQADAGMWFKMPGGYFAGQGVDGAAVREAPPSTTSLALNRIERGARPPRLTPALREELAKDFARWRVRSVVLG